MFTITDVYEENVIVWDFQGFNVFFNDLATGLSPRSVDALARAFVNAACGRIDEANDIASRIYEFTIGFLAGAIVTCEVTEL